MSSRHQEGLAHLLYGIDNGGGFIVLTGEVGTGKTTLCHSLLQQLPDDIDIALILNPKLDSLELLANICDELGIRYDARKASLKDFTDLLNSYLLDAHARGRRTVVMIDEAQNLSLDVLEQIRLLTNLETAKTKLLQIVLVGQPELKNLLNQEQLRQLNQRITARYHLEPLTLEESRTYIQHRLSVSGGDSTLFKDSAIRRIYKISHGIPRLINILCDRSLLGAYATGVSVITPGIVNKAAKEALDLEARRLTQIQLFFLLMILVVAGLFLVNSFMPLLTTVKQPSSVAEQPETQPPQLPAQEPEQLTPEPEQNPEKPEPDPPATVQHLKPATPVADFYGFINNPELSLQRALIQAFALWGETIPEQQPVNCDYARQRGFRCLLDRGSLKDLLGLKRPAILEFTLTDGQKRHALLVGMHRGYPVLRSRDGDVIFRLEDVLNNWQGYYLILWKPLLRGGMSNIYPQTYSNNVPWLRQQLDRIDGEDSIHTTQPRFFDRQLEKRVKRFQRQHHLQADGIVGPKTIIYLQNTMDSEHYPKLEHTD